jgi:hypothetical protein
MTILQHYTSFAGAESILWNNAIYGGSISGEWSHERRPHFYIEGWPNNGNALPVKEEIMLRFETDMPLASPLNDRPIQNVVNTHWNKSGFWQATVFEGQTITFIGAHDLFGNVADGAAGGIVLKRLIALNTGIPIETRCRQEKNSGLPEGPDIFESVKVLLFGRPNKEGTT